MGKTIYIETTVDMDLDLVGMQLERIGYPVSNIRETTGLHDGVILTDLRAKGTWEYETGYEHRDPEAGNDEVRHRAFEELTPAQQQRFVSIVSTFMCRSVYEEFLASEALQGLGFDDCLLER